MEQFRQTFENRQKKLLSKQINHRENIKIFTGRWRGGYFVNGERMLPKEKRVGLPQKGTVYKYR